MSAKRQAPAVFGRRIARERARRGWSMRDFAAKCGEGFSQNTVKRAEDGFDVALSGAVALAAALGMTLDALLVESPCGTCDGFPPAGFICGECGRGDRDRSDQEGRDRVGRRDRTNRGDRQ